MRCRQMLAGWYRPYGSCTIYVHAPRSGVGQTVCAEVPRLPGQIPAEPRLPLVAALPCPAGLTLARRVPYHHTRLKDARPAWWLRARPVDGLS